MHNPARSLYDIFTTWRDAGITQSTKRIDFGDPLELAGSEDLVFIFDLLRDLRVQLDRLQETGPDDMKMFLDFYPQWVSIAVARNEGWTKQVTGDMLVPEHALNMLNALAMYLRGNIFQLPADAYMELPNALSEAVYIVETTEELSDGLRLYILNLIREAHAALDDERIGAVFDFESAAMRLYTAFRAASLEVKDENKSRFVEIAKRLGTTITSSAVSSATGLAVGTAYSQLLG